MAEQYNATDTKLYKDSKIKEIDLINRDPKLINEDVVKVRPKALGAGLLLLKLGKTIQSFSLCMILC